MILAAHQPNFIPWLPFFDKMNKADIFVLMINCQFEKNGYQNRSNIAGSWWTCPVQGGKETIKHKRYVNGNTLTQVNTEWINAIALTLGIDTGKIRYDFPTEATGTARIIELCKYYDCDQYLTNPEATKKYLDEKKLNNNGIEIIPYHFEHRISIFEAFDIMGIEKVQKILKREKQRCAI